MLSNPTPEEIIRSGSKSFSFASLFFSQEERLAAAKIYSWCRHCDDLADEGHSTVSVCDEIRSQTMAAWRSEAVEAPYSYLQEVVHTYNIPSKYALDLITGMENDLRGKRYRSLTDLRHYCYYVAGTVGLIMSHVMGVFRESALDKAVELGTAMQLTNICRDVKEDYEIGRIYLPLEYLEQEGVDISDMMNLEYRDRLFKVVRRLIQQSEASYKKGQEGIIDLPIRAAFVITLAYKIYREINREILRRGVKSLDTRTIVPRHIKVWHIFSSLSEVFMSLPRRLMRKKTLIRHLPLWERVV